MWLLRLWRRENGCKVVKAEKLRGERMAVRGAKALEVWARRVTEGYLFIWLSPKSPFSSPKSCAWWSEPLSIYITPSIATISIMMTKWCFNGYNVNVGKMRLKMKMSSGTLESEWPTCQQPGRMDSLFVPLSTGLISIPLSSLRPLFWLQIFCRLLFVNRQIIAQICPHYKCIVFSGFVQISSPFTALTRRILKGEFPPSFLKRISWGGEKGESQCVIAFLQCVIAPQFSPRPTNSPAGISWTGPQNWNRDQCTTLEYTFLGNGVQNVIRPLHGTFGTAISKSKKSIWLVALSSG